MGGNQKLPASSSRTKFGATGGFSTGFGTPLTPTISNSTSNALSYLADLPDLSALQKPEVVVAFKNLFKRDQATKLRGLEDISGYVSSLVLSNQPDPEAESAVLDAWEAIYPRASIESDRRIRHLAHQLQGKLGSLVGKRLIPRLPSVIGPWLLGQYDNDKMSASAAQNALKNVFPTVEKVTRLIEVYSSNILRLCRDILDKHNPQTLSDQRFTSADEAEMKYHRVLASSIGLLGQVISSFSDKAIPEPVEEQFREILTDSKFWALISSKDASVRRSIIRFVYHLAKQPNAANMLGGSILTSQFVSKGLTSDQSQTATEFVDTLSTLTLQNPLLWTSNWSSSNKRPPISKIVSFLEKGSQSSSASHWDKVGFLLKSMPSETFSNAEDSTKILDTLQKGALKKEEKQSSKEIALKVVLLVTKRLCQNLEHDHVQRIQESIIQPVLLEIVGAVTEKKWPIPQNTVPSVLDLIFDLQKGPEIIEQNLPQLAKAVANMAKKSSNNDIDLKSLQDTLIQRTHNWEHMLKELERLYGENMPQTFLISLVEELMNLCVGSKGTHHGVAHILLQTLSHCFDVVAKSEEYQPLLERLLLQVVPESFMSSSLQPMATILALFKNQDRFFQTSWETCAEKWRKLPWTDDKGHNGEDDDREDGDSENSRIKREACVLLCEALGQSKVSVDDIDMLLKEFLKANVIYSKAFLGVLRLLDGIKLEVTTIDLLKDSLQNLYVLYSSKGEVWPPILKSMDKVSLAVLLHPELAPTFLDYVFEGSYGRKHPPSKRFPNLYQLLLSPNHRQTVCGYIQARLKSLDGSALGIKIPFYLEDFAATLIKSGSLNMLSEVLPDADFFAQCVKSFVHSKATMEEFFANIAMDNVPYVDVSQLYADHERFHDPLKADKAQDLALYFSNVMYSIANTALVTESDFPYIARLTQYVALLDSITDPGVLLYARRQSETTKFEEKTYHPYHRLPFLFPESQCSRNQESVEDSDEECSYNNNESILESFKFPRTEVLKMTIGLLWADIKSSSAQSYWSSQAYIYLMIYVNKGEDAFPGIKQDLDELEIEVKKNSIDNPYQAIAFFDAIHIGGTSFDKKPLKWFNDLVSDLSTDEAFENEETGLNKLLLLSSFTKYDFHTQHERSQYGTVSSLRRLRLVKSLVKYLPSASPNTSFSVMFALRTLVSHEWIDDYFAGFWGDLVEYLCQFWKSTLASWNSQDQEPVAAVTKSMLLNESISLYNTIKSTRIHYNDDDDNINNDLLDEALQSRKTNMQETFYQLMILPEAKDVGSYFQNCLDDKLAKLVATMDVRELNVQVEELYLLLNSQRPQLKEEIFQILHILIPGLQEGKSLELALGDIKEATVDQELLKMIRKDLYIDDWPWDATDTKRQIERPAVRSYLLKWLLIFDHFTNASEALQEQYRESLKPYFDTFFSNLLRIKAAHKLLDLNPSFDPVMYKTRPRMLWGEVEPIKNLYYYSLINLSGFFRDWVSNLPVRKEKTDMEDWISKLFTPYIREDVYSIVNSWHEMKMKMNKPNDGRPKMQVTCNKKAGEILVIYTFKSPDRDENFEVKILISLPAGYSLRPALVTSLPDSSSMFDEKRWPAWLRNAQAIMMTSQNNTGVIDGIKSWRRNVANAVSGKSDCSICYSLISADNKLPSKTCKKCKQVFHLQCLSKWFKTSGGKSCPLCRQNFYTGEAEKELD